MNVEISIRRKSGNIINTWKLKHMLLNNHWVIEVIKREIEKLMEINENGNTT